MAYNKYYSEGWKDNEEGGTPINAAALNNMEEGIAAAHEFQTRTDNPHSVTKAQVGLGNVPNVATNNQTPTYTAASTLAALISGEKLSVGFSKLAKAVSDLISHLGDNVRHITATERTAWNAKPTGIKGNAESAYRTGNVNLTPANIGAVPTNRTINGKALSANIMLNASDVGAVDATKQATVDATQDERLDKTENLIKSMEIHRVASGNPVIINDGFDSAPVRSLVAEINYTQSGTGDPYPPGGNINILPLDPEYFLNTNGQDMSPSTRQYTTQETENGTVYTITSTAQTGITFTVTPKLGTVRVQGRATTRRLDFLFIDGNAKPDNYYSRFLQNKTIALYANPISGADQVAKGRSLGIYTSTGVNVRAVPSLKQTIPNVLTNSFNIGIPITVTDYDLDITFQPIIITLDSSESALPPVPDWSPWSNIRPITGFDNITITRTGENDANPQSVTVQLTDDNNNPLTVHSGNLNLTTGLLTVTHALLTTTPTRLTANFSMAESVSSSASTYFTFYNQITDEAFIAYDGPGQPDDRRHEYLCDCIKVSGKSMWGKNTAISIMPYGLNVIARLPIAYSSDLDAMRQEILNYLPATVSMYYPLRNPITYQLTPAQIATLAGYNQISADSGAVDVTYRADPTLAYQELESNLTNAILSLGAGI